MNPDTIGALALAAYAVVAAAWASWRFYVEDFRTPEPSNERERSAHITRSTR